MARHISNNKLKQIRARHAEARRRSLADQASETFGLRSPLGIALMLARFYDQRHIHEREIYIRRFGAPAAASDDWQGWDAQREAGRIAGQGSGA